MKDFNYHQRSFTAATFRRLNQGEKNGRIQAGAKQVSTKLNSLKHALLLHCLRSFGVIKSSCCSPDVNCRACWFWLLMEPQIVYKMTPFAPLFVNSTWRYVRKIIFDLSVTLTFDQEKSKISQCQMTPVGPLSISFC